jgi:tmRNA-binding protein
VVSARNEINNSVASGAPLKVNQFLTAGFTGVTEENIGLVNADIAKLNEENKQDLRQIEKIVLKYATVDKVAQGKSYSSYDLVNVGLIPQDSKIKTSILSALKKLPASDLDTYEKIQAAVAKVEKQSADRKERLAAILAKKR